MEGSVVKVVNQVADDDASSEDPKYLTSNESRIDVACFVLNRVPQRYVSSARGRAHIEQEEDHDQQLFVDMVTLAHEGFRRVTSVQRSFYDEESHWQPAHGPHFLFPTIKGRFFDGVTFAPISGVEVTLLHDGAPVTMIDARWQNPYLIDAQTAGTYIFWPAPIAAKTEGEARSFEFEIRVEADGYDPFHHFFEIDRNSTSDVTSGLTASGEHALSDLYLVHSD
jgi:competence protein ComFB